MEIKIIASGSTGNCYRVSDGKTQILLDAGIPIKRIQVACHFKISELAGCLISHSHQDHCKAAAELARAGLDIYTSSGTIEACALAGHRIHALKALEAITVGSWVMLPFDTLHDAPEPLGFLLFSTHTQEKLLYFTDSMYIKYRFEGLHYIMAEANYDLDSIKHAVEAGYIPIELVPRLLKNHMSLDHLIDMLKANNLSQIRQIYLMHLSRNNSNAARFKTEVQKATGAEVYICG